MQDDTTRDDGAAEATQPLILRNPTAASKGGKARAQKMSPQERSESAKLAATARWQNASGNASGHASSKMPKEEYTGVLDIGGVSIECGNLDNGMRVLPTRGVSRAFGSKTTGTRFTKTGAPQLPPFLAAKNLSPFISADLMERLNNPTLYRPKQGGRAAHGYDAELLPLICCVLLDARNANALRPVQEPLAQMAEIMLRNFAKLGIVALIDEATGYQADRQRDDLARLLKAYIAEDLHRWLSRFPHEFFKHIHRLWQWDYREDSPQGPRYVGKLINSFIYERLPPGVLKELREKNPIINGRRKHRHYWWLTEGTGIPHLDKLISDVTTILAISDDKGQFEYLLKKRHPIKGDQLVIASTARVEPRDEEE